MAYKYMYIYRCISLDIYILNLQCVPVEEPHQSDIPSLGALAMVDPPDCTKSPRRASSDSADIKSPKYLTTGY